MQFDIIGAGDTTRHRQRDVTIFFVLEGGAFLHTPDGQFVLQQEDIVVVNSMEPASCSARKGTLIGILSVDYFELLSCFDADAWEFRCNSAIDRNKGYQEMRTILRRIFSLYFEREKQKVYLQSLYYELLHIMITYFSCRRRIQDRQYASDDEKRMDEIVRYIHTYYQYPVSLQDLADHLHLSSAYVSKYIKKHLGINFLTYLGQVRLEHAALDLTGTKKSVSQIALDNGFPNTAAFSSAYRAAYGELPSVRRKRIEQHRQQENPLSQTPDKEKSIHAFLEKQVQEPRSAGGEKADISADASQILYDSKGGGQLINIGALCDLLDSGLQEHLLILHRELGITYVRFWDVFSDVMLMDFRKTKGQQNFKRFDMAVDFLIHNDMHPFVELGFKPVRLLSRSVGQNVTMQEREPVCTASKEYKDALRALLTHCVHRYGMREVEQWYFEQWGDPRITQGDGYGTYFQIFEQAFRVIKAVSPAMHVGGAGFGRLYSTLEFEDIISLWGKQACQPDFISMYAYPYMARNSAAAEQNNDRIQDPDFVRNQVLMMREALGRASMHVPQLLVTEWGLSVSDWNCLNDSVYKGAFILKHAIDNSDLLDGMGYWLASDMLTEYFDTGKLLHGGNGLLTSDGIRKPAFYALQFMASLYPHVLARTPQALVTANGRGDFEIVCHHYVHPNFRYYFRQEDEIDVRRQYLLFDDAQELQLHIQIRHVRNGRYTVKTHALNEKTGSVQDIWRQMNYSEALSQRDVRYLKGVSTPKISMTDCTVTNQTLKLDTILAPQEIQNIHIIYQET